MDHPLEAVLGGGLQESGGGRRIHRTHLATLTGVQAEHRTCMEQGIDPVQGGPECLVVGQVGDDHLDAVGIEVVEYRSGTDLGGVAYDGPYLMTGGHGRSHAVGAEEPRGPGDRNLHVRLPGPVRWPVGRRAVTLGADHVPVRIRRLGDPDHLGGAHP